MKKQNFRPRTLLTALVIGVGGLTTVACTPTRTHESAGEYSQDALVTTRVKAALVKEPNLKSMSISVDTFRGTVQLSGFVDNATQIARAVSVTRGVDGVEAVKNDLHVKTQ